jgi:hypothetical protein
LLQGGGAIFAAVTQEIEEKEEGLNKRDRREGGRGREGGDSRNRKEGRGGCRGREYETDECCEYWCYR